MNIIKGLIIPEIKSRRQKFLNFNHENYLLHSNINFNPNSKEIQIYDYELMMASKNVKMYLWGVRQELWRRCRKIRGFSPLLGYSYLYNEVLLVSNTRSNTRQSFISHCDDLLNSEAHNNILRWCTYSEVSE